MQGLFSLADRTALITGASGGIGRAIAVAYAESGARVAVHGTDAGRLEMTRKAVEAAGGPVVTIQAALDDGEASVNLVREAGLKLGRLDILVNCAGTNRRKPIRDTTVADFDHIVAVNLKSVFFASQAAAAIMKPQGGGRIINVGSVTSSQGLGGVAVYGATKAAVAQLTRTMALEWAADQILVNCLAPGFILTPLTRSGLWGDPHRSQWLKGRIPMKRPGQPEELIGAAVFLASPASSYMTGQVLNVDGGYLAGGSWLLEDE